jgi:hypothetical protein
VIRKGRVRGGKLKEREEELEVTRSKAVKSINIAS